MKRKLAKQFTKKKLQFKEFRIKQVIHLHKDNVLYKAIYYIERIKDDYLIIIKGGIKI